MSWCCNVKTKKGSGRLWLWSVAGTWKNTLKSRPCIIPVLSSAASISCLTFNVAYKKPLHQIKVFHKGSFFFFFYHHPVTYLRVMHYFGCQLPSILIEDDDQEGEERWCIGPRLGGFHGDQDNKHDCCWKEHIPVSKVWVFFFPPLLIKK